MAFSERPDTDTMLEALFTSDFTRDEDSWNEQVEADRPGAIVIPEPDEEGNFETPASRSINAAWDAFAEDRVDAEQMTEFLDTVGKAIDTQLAFMDQMVAAGEEDPDNPIHQWIYGGFSKQREALDKMKRFFTEGDEAVVEAGLDEFQDGTNQMMQGYAEFQKLRLEAMRISCPKCGADALRGDPKCPSCGTALPQPELPESQMTIISDDGLQTTIQEEGLSTPNFEKMDIAVDAWRHDELDKAGLQAVHTEVKGNFDAHLADVKKERQRLNELSAQEQEIMVGLLNGTEEALNKSLAAMEKIGIFFETDDPIHLDRGLDQLWEATKLIIRAYQAHEQIVAKAQKDTGETFE